MACEVSAQFLAHFSGHEIDFRPRAHAYARDPNAFAQAQLHQGRSKGRADGVGGAGKEHSVWKTMKGALSEP
jgi:hypothetical protein